CDSVSLFAEEIAGSEPGAGEDAFPEIPIRFFGTSGMEKISSAIVITYERADKEHVRDLKEI
ncbi:MAG: hypothetical protein HYU03_00450, partial [Thaumarchaeota archaeon]|nr:hypothetical protein [Nitrososphaerota archaeon]